MQSPHHMETGQHCSCLQICLGFASTCERISFFDKLCPMWKISAFPIMSHRTFVPQNVHFITQLKSSILLQNMLYRISQIVIWTRSFVFKINELNSFAFGVEKGWTDVEQRLNRCQLHCHAKYNMFHAKSKFVNWHIHQILTNNQTFFSCRTWETHCGTLKFIINTVVWVQGAPPCCKRDRVNSLISYILYYCPHI